MGSKTSLIKFNFSNATETPLPHCPFSLRHDILQEAVLCYCLVLLYTISGPLLLVTHILTGLILPQDSATSTPMLLYNFTLYTEDRFHTVTVTRQHRHYKNGISILIPILHSLVSTWCIQCRNICFGENIYTILTRAQSPSYVTTGNISGVVL